MNLVKIGFLIVVLATTACNQGSGQGLLDANQFEAKLNAKPDAQVVDVRTAEEYNDGHLANAQNINVDGADFNTQIAKLDKSKPVFVYCLAGSRSATAAGKFKKLGFTEVYDLKGGIRAWKAADKPLASAKAAQKGPVGLTKGDLDKMLAEKEFTVVDFTAKWCGPCKQLSPILDKIAKEWGVKLNVIKIDVDANPLVSDAYSIESIPALIFFSKTKMLGKTLGWSGEEKLRSDITSYGKLAGVSN